VFDLKFFQQPLTYTASYKQHNAALKWFRHRLESQEHPLPHKLPNNVAVAAIVHPPGMGYTFNTDVSHDWSWLEMVAQLDRESMAFVVSGPDNRSGGLVGCDVDSRPGSYDHARHHALRVAGAPEPSHLPIWDFVLRRNDGTSIRLHPQWSSPKVDWYEVKGHAPPVSPPVAGLGKSDGPGTYKFFKGVATKGTLKFDAAKRPEHCRLVG
jgi:hypothetical protein